MSLAPSLQPDLADHDACGVGLIYRPSASHQVIRSALTALERVEHRGACAADGQSGDGAGILTSIPWQIYVSEGLSLDNVRAVAVVFLPTEAGAKSHCKAELQRFLHEEGLNCAAWRSVPTDIDVLGTAARETLPAIEHVLISSADPIDDLDLEQRLMVVRKRVTNQLWSHVPYSDFYIASLSSRTIVYKAMTTSEALSKFYSDLCNEAFIANFAIFHRRFSTNTMPRWRLAQPFRLLGHNGEINTLAGNRRGLLARSKVMESTEFMRGNEPQWPLVHPTGSDSANLDNVLEFLVCTGLSPEEALMRLIPESCGAKGELCETNIGAFYEYHAAHQEPWDGPALIAYSDGRTAGALLDKNGLRPARYTILTDGTFLLSSETGAFDAAPEMVAKKGRLGPGEIISVNLETGEISFADTVRKRCAASHPYAEWLSEERVDLPNQGFGDTCTTDATTLEQQLIIAGVGAEELNTLMSTAATAKEPIFSMGDDAVLAVLSHQPRVIYDYFKQRFAQVTNPPIDHLRERMVMSISTYLGPKNQSIMPSRAGARLIRCDGPVLNDAELDSLSSYQPGFVTKTVSTLFRASESLEVSIERLCAEVETAVRDGANIIILSDRAPGAESITIPALCAVGAVHSYLIENRLRTFCSLVVETAQCWSPHHLACLLGYGAEAVSPYLVWDAIKFHAQGQGIYAADFNEISVETAQQNYRYSLEDSLLKILCKMGITMLSSYIGGQLFEIVGLSNDVVARCFPGSPSHVNGLGFVEIENEQRAFHVRAFDEFASDLPEYGHLKNKRFGEFHGNNPDVVRVLHQALGLRDKKADAASRRAMFQNYSDVVSNRPPSAIRDLLQQKSDRPAVPVEFVESGASIVKRFCTGGMSLGALSREAHEVLAIAMNRLGGKSNSGEGGEDPERYRATIPDADSTLGISPLVRGVKRGDNPASAIRQVASARFGVTPEYVATARQLEIKIAQGAKPGEGGQLPAHKVSEYIAKLRRSNTGVTLISPPPHHDIYSIEDLAQLIYDLRQVNPRAAVSVKLVASSGIGTIAAGVAKANADIIQISGHDGGTGASPVSSIKNAGIPWEIGLAETHKTLLRNGLRDRVVLRADGGLKTGWDIVTAAMLGAQEYGFGTIALIAAGCIMARVCHTNNCPVGVTSQREELRKKFVATPDQVERFFLHLAEEVRFVLAGLGFTSLDEIIGRTDLLQQKQYLSLPKIQSVGLNNLLEHIDGWQSKIVAINKNGTVLDDQIVEDPEVRRAINNHSSVSKSYRITNQDRGVGARLSGAVVLHYGDHGFGGTIHVELSGCAGQSFGAFNTQGIELDLTGEANDYVGKGMNGGQIVIRPPAYPNLTEPNGVIVGNACLYGATGGSLFAAGTAGERFAVRNSAATAVIEGAGDHCCEYMTGGTVVVLGKVGRNFGAGMTDGAAFVYDVDDQFTSRVNYDMDKDVRRPDDWELESLRGLVQRHHELTGSDVAGAILKDWDVESCRFWQVSFIARKVPRSEVQAQPVERFAPAPIRD